jgi:hypothetical protein
LQKRQNGVDWKLDMYANISFSDVESIRNFGIPAQRHLQTLYAEHSVVSVDHKISLLQVYLIDDIDPDINDGRPLTLAQRLQLMEYIYLVEQGIINPLCV